LNSLRFGLSLPNRAVLFGLPAQTLLQAAAIADRSGAFDSVWVGDNFLSKPRLEAIVTLAALAARTTHLRLGTVCLASLTLRDPLALAIQWASLDVISAGRSICGVCIGGSARQGPAFAAELTAFGVRSEERAARMEEGVELLRRFWGEQPVSFSGRFRSYESVQAYPKPVQARIPIIIAVNPSPHTSSSVVERALRRVARLADGWQTDGTPPDVFRERWEQVRAYASEYGREDQLTDSSLHLMVNINNDARHARRESVEFLDRYYGAGAVGEDILEHWLAFGSPAAVIEKIGLFVEAGCTTPILRFTSPDQEGQLERCLAEVLPAFRET
jgi:alkanesulfonate monooxygenase SsuD/methylene tetrahydromethanopterin reductase-like flavin-dependent oxidoreductase (luciferase family)